MTPPRDDDLQRALERLTVQDVWRRAGLPDPPARDGNLVVKSPFREDRHGKAFSIFKRGLLAKDQGTGEVFNVYSFAEKATGLTGKDLVDRLCEWAGISRTVHIRTALRNAMDELASGATVEVPKELQRLARKLERKDQERAAEKALQERLESMRAPKVEVRELHEWSPVVRARFLEGWRALGADEERQSDWAKERGWPVEWVRWLHRRGLIASPWVPWCEEGEERAQRGKAFAVDVPDCEEVGPLRGLRRIGYHQRYWMLGERRADGSRGPEQRQWTYVPYMPGVDKQRTKFQREMVTAELARGGEIGVSRVVGVPFVLGDLYAPRLLVITEGQWDAVSFAGACGWLAIDPDEWGVAVMGARGNEGAETLLAYWRSWIAFHKPAALVLADNDAAGRKWDAVEPRERGQVVPPTLADKLRAAGARRVYVSRVRPELGKDFNDYWRARRPAASAMMAWLRDLDFCDREGRWR